MPTVSLLGTTLTQDSFDEVDPDGKALHFRDRFADAAELIPITYLDPLTGVDTLQTARQIIQAQVALHGWPLTGIYVSGSGGSIPHFALHVDDFPTQGGPPDQRPNRLQEDLNAAFERIYKSSQTITDPEDPDFGQTVDIRSFWAVCHVWNYPATVPREEGAGDYLIRISDGQPPGNWWQQF